MNPLEQAEVNSMRLIEERLAKLDEELAMMEQGFPQREGENAATSKPSSTLDVASGTRYIGLPAIDLPPPKKSTLKPQITPEYTQSLQHAPSLLSLYSPARHEPCFLSDLQDLRLPPRILSVRGLLCERLEERNSAKQLWD
jgi:hypothetical protein